MSTATLQQDQVAPYQQPVDAVLAVLSTDAQSGLSQGEAQARLKSYGKNELTAEKPVPAWRKFLAQFHDVLVILLLIAQEFQPGCGSSSATLRCPTKRSPSWRSSCSTRSWVTCSSHGRSKRWRRCARCRRHTPTSCETARGSASRRLRSCPAISSSLKQRHRSRDARLMHPPC